MYNHKIPFNNKKLAKKITDLYGFASDAGLYRIIPEYTARPENIDDIQGLLSLCRSTGRHITFRAAGTSLSGQSVGSSILAVITGGWEKFEISSGGEFVKTQPAMIAGRLNNHLEKFGRKLGPDPASINSCTAGGIAANNSSGMSSGTSNNPYNTIAGMTFILPDGTVIDSLSPYADDKLRLKEPEIYNGLLKIRQEILSDLGLKEKIGKKYRLKNTIGYGLNSFLDYEKPADILTRLMIGSEGTLGFIADITFRTVPLYTNHFTGLLFFENSRDACDAISVLKNEGAAALEFMDYRTLYSVSDKEGVPSVIKELPGETAGLLFEFSGPQPEYVEEIKNKVSALIKGFPLIRIDAFDSVFFAETTEERSKLWNVRQGLLTSLSGTREKGQSVVIEDVAFDLDILPEAINELQKLFVKFGYDNTGIYGHGLDGNLHFMLAVDFSVESCIPQYDSFMQELAELVTGRFDGSLKAEHGTGRNMAPFVEKEWGTKAYSIMKSIKKLIDPDNILNPGVLINDDAKIHLKNIKEMPVTDDIIDLCIECGFCESVCPSSELTLSPRRRIILQRELHRLSGDRRLTDEIRKELPYQSVETCAVDGLCSLVCPLGINTGEFTKKQREENNSRQARKTAEFLSRRIGMASGFARAAVRAGRTAAKITGTNGLNKIIGFSSKILGHKLPVWKDFISGPPKILARNKNNSDVVYFSCCVTRIFGSGDTSDERPGLAETVLAVSGRAGLNVSVPEYISDHCCGMAFQSKGYTDAYRETLNRTVEAMYEWTNGGELPVLMDSSSCALSMKTCLDYVDDNNKEKYLRLKILDMIEFLDTMVIDKLKIKPKDGKAIVFPPCSVRKMGLETRLTSLAEKCAGEVIAPSDSKCCGFAGDRGLLYPELTESATRSLVSELRNIDAMGCYSTNSPCEIGLSNALGRQFANIAYLVYDTSEDVGYL